jgi:lysophospholipase L1-like esterase
MRYLCAVCLLLLPPSGAALGQGPLTIHLAGDSTMAEKRPDKRPETGWGELLHKFLDPAKVRVENHAQNGRSTKTFIAEGRWPALVEKLKPGDYVFIQFGHNDQPPEKASHTPPADYRANLVRFVRDARAKQATPVLFTPVVRRRFDDKGEFYDTHFDYPDIVRAVAAEHRVALIDMHRKSEGVLRKYGAEGSKKLFLQLKPGEHPNYPKGVEDNTHFSPQGAEEMARLAAEGVRELKLGLDKHLKPRAKVAYELERGVH